MFDYSKLRGRIIEKYSTLGNFAKKIGKDNAYITRYLNGKTEFNQTTVDMWAEALDISCYDIGIYFYTKKVAN